MKRLIDKMSTTLRKPHFKTGLVYLVFSALWIIFSDEMVATIGQDITQYKNLQLIKGLFFVTVTALIIFFMIRKDHYIKEKQKISLEKSEEKLQEHNEELQLLNEELSQTNEQIRKINQELTLAKEKAEESERLKSAFLANMSHEIRTPLNGILGFADLLQDPKLTKQEFQQYKNMLEKGSSRMINTINDLVEIARLESGQLSLNKSAVDIHALLNELCEFYAVRAEERGISFKLNDFPVKEEGFYIRTDEKKLESILNKLLDNAIKFTFRGRVTMGYEISEKSLRFVVQDTGIGIPPEKQTLIFKRFIQADTSHTRPYEGSGLGLAIAKSYSDLMLGKIEVISEPSKGSTFTLQLPYSRVEENSRQVKPTNTSKVDSSPSATAKPHILIVEDDEASYLMLKIILSRHNYTISWAKSGEEALRIYRSEPTISLILMDLKLPGIDGYEATRLIRSQNPDVPIIAQSAYALSGDELNALKAGCNDYISKPVHKKVLLQKVGAFVV